MYSRLIETYLTVCRPDLNISTRQLGWSGETAERFLKRMDQDCLRFEPTIATLCYGMNDARYRPFDLNNGRWYRDHYGLIVDKLQAIGARVVVGSPGCSGKIATWVKSRSGTLDEHNQHLCALRDIAMEMAAQKQVAFADLFWPMYQAQVEAPKKYATPEKPYRVTGQDGIHPGWAGQVIMAYGFLRSLGLDGNLATFTIDWERQAMDLSPGHQLVDSAERQWTIESDRYPFCASGEIDAEGSIRSGMTLVPFDQSLNRWTLVVQSLDAPRAMVRWGKHEKSFSRQELQRGVNLATQFHQNPFSKGFDNVDQAVAKKQAFETVQIKQIVHGKRGKENLEQAFTETEAQRQELVDAIRSARKPVTHTLVIVHVHD